MVLAIFPLIWDSSRTQYIPYQSSIVKVFDCLGTPPKVEAAHLSLRQYVHFEDIMRHTHSNRAALITLVVAITDLFDVS